MKTKLKNIAKIQTGVFAKPVSKGDVIYLQPKYFNGQGVLMAEVEPDLNSIGLANNHILQKGDVLFSAKGTKNFATVYNMNTPAAAASSFFIIRVSSPTVLPEYLALFINHPTTINILKRQARGSSIASISKNTLEDLELPVPSIEKQKAITKLDGLRQKEHQIKMKLLSLRESQIQQQLLNALNN